MCASIAVLVLLAAAPTTAAAVEAPWSGSAGVGLVAFTLNVGG